MATPLQRLAKRISPRKSHSKTRHRLPRTFSDILPWEDFQAGAQELYESLDNTVRCYNQPTLDLEECGASMMPAADESEVRGSVVYLFQSVNRTAIKLGIPAEYTGGGGGRSLSFTDLLMRPAGALSDPADLSSQVLGTVEVKGDWQFSLQQGERLEDALHDPRRVGDIVQAVQQVRTADQSNACDAVVIGACHNGILVPRQASPAVSYGQLNSPTRESLAGRVDRAM